VEDGFTRTANALVEAFARSPLTSREARVVRVVERMTYGWNKPEDWIAASVISEMTGMSEGKCSETLNGLIRKRVLIRNGGGRSPVRINKDVDQWDFTAQKKRVTPKRKADPDWGKSPQNGVSESPQNGDTPKDRKDITPPSNEGERTGEPERDSPSNEKSSSKLPNCPHEEILDLWAEIMPEKPQHSKNLWQGTERARHLAARWKAGFTIKHERTGKPLYTTREEGIAWWGKFFRFLRKSEFLMSDNHWFKLAWAVKRENFVKIMELSYHDGGEA